jgi:hypothetical protein
VKRREFVTLLSAAAAWPLAARAQQGEQMRHIGLLSFYAENDAEGPRYIAKLLQGMQQLGWMDGRNVQIDYRWAGADRDRFQRYATELVGLKPDLIVGQSTPAVAALLQATRAIPIVFVNVSDPVGSGFVESLPRPGSNITGFSNFEPAMGGKWVELLPGGGLVMLSDGFTLAHRDLIVRLAEQYRVPVVYPFREFAKSGGFRAAIGTFEPYTDVRSTAAFGGKPDIEPTSPHDRVWTRVGR